ncbi:carboxymuconolactone decarboxylase family protein [Streptomyces luomodiensis]|uniref:Carboxymuconolactone decarboxylase family protein n=1 Tax=Streptomyces luomodiensis TaxID=3026192 RepID=A0ABY9V902_9ACTN|nr:carboxymuconolactone decarboxylase family protein [Streptomyces sp. SCA4-21]WNF00350.1 carboxymuconolactone decarboxylase family protein [Streptomyces sp. SCA4-21]
MTTANGAAPVYPLSAQETLVSNLDLLRETSGPVADAFRGLRRAADDHGPLEAKQRELCLLTGFAVSRNEPGFRVHCNRAKDAGATVEEIEQVVILMLGTSLGLVPVVEALNWVHDELR